jgi:hypothetical protein
VLGVVAGDEVVATEIVVAGVGGQDVPGGDEPGGRRRRARLPPGDGTRRNRAREARVPVRMRCIAAVPGGFRPASPAGRAGFIAASLVVARADANGPLATN